MLSDLANTINRHRWIAEAAYYKAEARNFKPGRALNDWLEAEIIYSKTLIAAYVAILQEDGAPITTVSLQHLAAVIGIENPDGLVSEPELVRAIQRATKHRPCFRSEANKLCQETECQWRDECRTLISEWYS